MDHLVQDHHDDQDGWLDTSISRRGFFTRGLAAFGGAAALSLTGWGGESIKTAMARLGAPSGPKDDAYWTDIRAQFPFEPGLTYLNNGGLGAPPKPVVDAVIDGYKRISANPSIQQTDLNGYIRDTVRPALAQFVGADPMEIAFTRNATEGLNFISNGIEMKPGDEVITTTHEHPAGINPWLLKSQRYGIVVRQVRVPTPPNSASEVIDIFRRAINSRTKVLFFCHITRGPGLLYPVKELCAMARERGIVSAVDGAQSVGMMEFNVSDLGCDLFANSLHKWVLTPIGTGMIYVRKEFQERFFPMFAGSGPWDVALAGSRRYEAIGTYDVPVRAGVGAALEFINKIGIKNIEARNRMLSDYAKSELAKVPRVSMLT